jgi:hypothetical protein
MPTIRKVMMLSIILILSLFATALTKAYASTSFTIGSTQCVNNKQIIQMDIAPYIDNNRAFLPIRYVAVALGVMDAYISYCPTSQTVDINEGDKFRWQDIDVTIGSKIMTVNNSAVNMDVAPEIIDGRTCLPVAWIAKAFNIDVIWDANTQTVTLGDDSSSQTTIPTIITPSQQSLQYNDTQTVSNNLAWQYPQYNGTSYSLQTEVIKK